MASSPPSSPAASRDTSPAPMLTPRSKIKALLATVDSSDDEGSPTTKKTKKTAPAALDSDSDVPVKPRGKLASRMQGAASVSPQAPKDAPGDARERVKQMIQREAAAKETEKDTTETPAEQNDDDEDEDEAPVTTRRIHRRPERETTPDTTEQDGVSNSPGLFVSPAPPTPSHDLAPAHGSDSEADLPSYKSDRFKALVERKRKEREAREAEEEARRAERYENLAAEATRAQSDDDVGGISDDEGGRNLSQSMPKRKASKKAVEEIERETQRIQRNMQLRHEALTRKKVTKSSLFDRFNYRPAGEPEPAPEKAAPPQQQQPESSHPTTPPSEVEMKDPEAQTPPSSPPSASKIAAAAAAAQTDGFVQQAELDVAAAETEATPKAKPRVRVQLPPSKIGKVNLDEDDELEVIVTVQDKVNAVFENVPKKKAEGAGSLQVFRAFAMANSPERVDRRRKGPVSKMSTSELQTSLQQRARAQAKVERDRRMATLKAQGIVIQTAEERERQEAEVEDLVAKAREEAQRLMKEERAEVKKDRLENGERDALDWDDSEEEYEDSANEADGEGSEIELSGSEDEGADEDADGEEEVEGENKDVEAVAETEAAEATKDEDEEMVDEPVAPTVKRRKARNVTAILSDDDEEGGVTVEATPRPIRIAAQMSPMTGNNGSPAAPTSVIRSAKKTFIPGLPVHGAAGMGLTQIFAGTMDSQMSPSASGPTQSMMPDFDHFPASNLPPTTDDDEEMEDIIKSSQPEAVEETQGSTQGVRLDMSQSQMHGLDSLIRADPFTQPSQDIEPSQDMGLQTYTPIRERFVDAPQSTVDTVIQSGQAQETGADSPLVQRKGRLRRKAEPEAVAEDDVRVTQDINMDTFAAMKEKATKDEKRRLAEDFNHKKSKAKEMVQEQAEESEDEYAGVGGVDGEDSDNESNASVQEMIDDDAGNNEDEEKLAAFYANREIADDEKAVEKLYKDITTGALRRKRGADYDLSDSDDGGEARRRLKRRQFAKMQKALFADERVQKMATDPGNEAFLRTMHDRGSDDEVDLLGDIQEGEASRQDDSDSPAPSQGAEKAHVIPDSQPRKVLSSAPENRAPAHMRRTKDGRKPSNIGEVRETLSDLLEDPHGSVVSATDAGSDSEEDTPSNKENTSPNRRRSGVVDRISLKRTNSNMSTGSNSSRLAFSATGSASGFKVPMLLRRATTNSSMLSGSTTSSTAAEAGTGGFGEEAKIKKTASKKSGVVRGAERVNDGRAKLEENERRREQRKARGAEKRVGMVGGLLGKGSFA